MLHGSLSDNRMLTQPVFGPSPAEKEAWERKASAVPPSPSPSVTPSPAFQKPRLACRYGHDTALQRNATKGFLSFSVCLGATCSKVLGSARFADPEPKGGRSRKQLQQSPTLESPSPGLLRAATRAGFNGLGFRVH